MTPIPPQSLQLLPFNIHNTATRCHHMTTVKTLGIHLLHTLNIHINLHKMNNTITPIIVLSDKHYHQHLNTPQDKYDHDRKQMKKKLLQLYSCQPVEPGEIKTHHSILVDTPFKKLLKLVQPLLLKLARNIHPLSLFATLFPLLLLLLMMMIIKTLPRRTSLLPYTTS
jgi:hypothetical protein